MKENDHSPSLWKRVQEEGFVSILGKLLFGLLVYGLLLVLILEIEGSGVGWIRARFPILEVAGEVSPVGLYISWLVTLWLGFRFGRHVGMKRGAGRERQRLGIPY